MEASTLLGIDWSEWFLLGLLLALVWGPMLALVIGFQRRHLDDPDCSKFNIFTADPTDTDDDSEAKHPNPPLSCRLRYLENRSFWDGLGMNTRWIWMTLGIGAMWTIVILVAFVANRYSPGL